MAALHCSTRQVASSSTPTHTHARLPPNPPAAAAAAAHRSRRVHDSECPAQLAVEVVEPVQVKPRMIIKGMLGRYERWNPVHPTVGTFWGIGLGLGCGVGWGPGFGPEVIGYVGAGCGVGFSVGVTLAGVGVGLPQHGLIRNQYHSGFASNIPFESARFYTLTIIRGLVWDAISYASQVAAVRKESRQRLLNFHENPQISGGVNLPKLGKDVSSSIQSTMEWQEQRKTVSKLIKLQGLTTGALLNE
uniref:Cadmium-induced protein AS8 n=1 Tax=Oryza punctata TaxID=4537 RepID=A0A0E0LH34_ORYPU